MFRSPSEGWLVSGPESAKLFVTRNAAQSWEEVVLPPPPAAGSATIPSYSLPTFQNKRDGFVVVTFSGKENAGTWIALFATHDSGRSWKIELTARNEIELSVGENVKAAVAGPVLIMANVVERQLHLVQVLKGQKSYAATATIPANATAVTDLKFVNPNEGWVLLGETLLWTVDKGQSWRDVTPTSRTLPNPRSSRISPSVQLEGKVSQPVPPAGLTSMHVGFDRCSAPSTNNMQTWWNTSPFFDVGVYIGGSSRSCSNPNLTSTWVTRVEQMG
jgi:photosystem II stability/assembly factor-like uncharacterized protein